jgi:hypothetical protein
MKWPYISKPPKAQPKAKRDPNKKYYPFWRIAHPKNREMLPGSPHRLYWDREKTEWSNLNYTIWSYDEWFRTFGNDKERNWEGFGFEIPLYDEGEE